MHTVYHKFIRSEDTGNGSHPRLHRRGTPADLEIGNDLSRDLYVFNKSGKLSSVFEVKPDLSLGSIYSGIGQLLLNSIEFSNKIKLILVLPEKPDENILSKLKKIGIHCLYYKWVNQKLYFSNLKDII